MPLSLTKELLMSYLVYVNRTGTVSVEAESEPDAVQQVMDMSTEEISQVACLVGYNVGDAVLELEDMT